MPCRTAGQARTVRVGANDNDGSGIWYFMKINVARTTTTTDGAKANIFAYPNLPEVYALQHKTCEIGKLQSNINNYTNLGSSFDLLSRLCE